MSSTMRSTWVCIRCQSSTASRTSMSTLVSCSWISLELVVGDPVDLEVHPGLAGHVVRVGLGVLVEHLVELAAEVASYDELRVDHQVDVVLRLGERHRDRVDEERHVVGDHLDDRVPAGGPAVDRDARGEHPDGRLALRSLGGEPQLGHHRAVEVGRVALEQVLGGDVSVERLQHRRQVHAVGRLGALGLGVGAQPGEEFGLALLQRRHGFDIRTAPAPRQRPTATARSRIREISEGSSAAPQSAERRSHSSG